jgi:hypothetical protein
MTKGQNNREAGQKQDRHRRVSQSRASTTEFHQTKGDSNTKPFAESAITAHPQRVSIADSFGASPASSALDVSARRDPGGNSINLTRNCEIESGLATNHFGRVKQNLSKATLVAGFETSTRGRF